MRIQREEKGITLIALIITIIVLLILAGVSIAMLTGENGILKRAEGTEIVQAQAELTEEIQLAIMESLIDRDNEHTIDNILKKAVANSYISLDDNPEHVLMEILTETEVASVSEISSISNSTDLGNNMYVPENCTSVKVVDANLGVWVRIYGEGSSLNIEEGTDVVDVAKIRTIEMEFSINPEEGVENEEVEITVTAKLKADSSKEFSEITLLQDPKGEALYSNSSELLLSDGEPVTETYIVENNGIYVFEAVETHGTTKSLSVKVTNAQYKNIQLTSNLEEDEWGNEAIITINYDEGFLVEGDNNVQYSIDGGKIWSNVDVKNSDKGIGEVVLSSNATIYVRYFENNVGTEPVKYQVTNIDNEAPKNFEIYGIIEEQTLEIELQNEVYDSGSGVDYYKYSVYNSDEELLFDWSDKAIYEDMQDTSYYIQGKVVDKAGNEYVTEKIRVKSFIEVGDYVNYPAINGYSGTWQILHLNTSGYVEIVATQATKEQTYSGVNAFYNWVVNLNSAVSGYLNTTYGVKVRHLGSNPTNPSINNTVSVTQTSDTYYTSDYNALVAGGISLQRTTWLASRPYNNYNAYGRKISTSRTVGQDLLFIYSSSSNYEQTNNLGPVVSLKSTVKLTNGNGTASYPWNLTL